MREEHAMEVSKTFLHTFSSTHDRQQPGFEKSSFQMQKERLCGGLGFRFQGVGFRAPTSELAESLKADVEKWQAQALSHEVRRCVTLLAIAIARQASSNFRTEESSLKLLAFTSFPEGTDPNPRSEPKP